MENNIKLYLLLLLGSGFYFYKKGSIDILIVILLFALYIAITNVNKEHLDKTSKKSPLEAIKNLSSMFNNEKITATNLDLTGNINFPKGNKYKENWINGGNLIVLNPKKQTHFKKDVEIKGNLIVDGDILMKNGKSIKSNGNLSVQASDLKTTGNIRASGNIYVPQKKSVVIGRAGLSDNTSNFVAYRTDDGHNILVANYNTWDFHTPHGGVGRTGGWNAYSNGIARV
jgi:hypothetical protein